MTTTENNVAAQAGDEPMREAEAVIEVCQEWCVAMYQHAANIGAGGPGLEKALYAKAQKAKAAIRALVSSRATADVERDRGLNKIADAIEADGLPNTAAELREIIATTKPGA